MNRTRVRLRAGVATLLAGSVLLPLMALPLFVVLPLVGLLAVAASWWMVPAERFRPPA